MAIIQIYHYSVAINEEGFLIDFTQWNEEIAQFLADREHIQLTPEHWEIIWLLREYYQQTQHLPTLRMFVKLIGVKLGIEKGNSRYLHRLFNNSPLKYACKIAGLVKPPNCL
ncbi:MAG: hypothetical protein RL637_442 [Pseudomonadota bacterium]|jgi:tRNA 2-thiouridine synthesizing protein E